MIVSANIFRSDELQAWALDNGTVGRCEISGNSDNLIDTTLLSDFWETLFSVYEEDTNGRELWKIIQEDWRLLKDDNIAERFVSQLLEEMNSAFTALSKVNYKKEIKDPCAHWDRIKQALKTERRFFAGDLVMDEDNKWDVFFASNYTISSGTPFKRARINIDENKLYNEEKDMGMPPADKAIAGRANVYGIPYLYLGADDLTVMYESRAIVNDILSIATFVTTSDIDVVDFTFKPDLYAVFQQSKDDFITDVQRYVFLNEVSKDLSKAVRRYDIKEIDYLSTQYVCEYIRLVTKAKGLIFQSSLYPDGKNVVLFSDKDVRFVDVKYKEVGSVTMAFSG